MLPLPQPPKELMADNSCWEEKERQTHLLTYIFPACRSQKVVQVSLHHPQSAFGSEAPSHENSTGMETPPQSHACEKSSGFVRLLKSPRVFSLLKSWLCLSHLLIPGYLGASFLPELMEGECSLCRCQGSISVATAEPWKARISFRSPSHSCPLCSQQEKENSAPTFFHTSRGADNSPREDLSSPPPEISQHRCLEMYRWKNSASTFRKKSPSKDMDKGNILREQMQVEAGELSSGAVLAVMGLSQ